MKSPAHAVVEAIERVLAPLGVARVAVAFSGGGDSTALLHATAAVSAALAPRIAVVALHVHHGLAVQADDWLAHARLQAEAFGTAFDTEHLAIDRTRGSIEAEARRLRYAALVRLCEKHDCTVLLTAHHADDQAETVLVNLARGAGVGGLAAMARSRRVDTVDVVRPLIDLPAATVSDYLEQHRLAHVDDPSNSDRRFTRNAIRHEVMPALRRIAPTIATQLARTAAHASTMQTLLDEIGIEDLASDDGDRLDVDRLRTLSDPRAANALRVWLARRGLRPPSTAALKEMLDQLLHASPDAQIALLHERQTLRLYRGRVSLDAAEAPRAGFVPLVWRGEERLVVPEWNGSLAFVPTDGPGFDARALREGPLALRDRRGGERIRMRADGPSRTLKNLYQEAGIAAWQRTRLPLVYLEDRLIHAAGLGDNASWTRHGEGTTSLQWITESRPVRSS